MTTTHKNRASACRAGDCVEERAGFSDPTAPVPATAFGNLDRGQGARSPRTHTEYAASGVSPRATVSRLATLPLALVCALGAFSANAHSAPSGMPYDPFCCHGNDCAPIRFSAVSITPQGYRIQLDAGEHPLLTEPLDQIIPFDHRGIRESTDGDFHLCIWLKQQDRCFYVPPFGS